MADSSPTPALYASLLGVTVGVAIRLKGSEGAAQGEEHVKAMKVGASLTKTCTLSRAIHLLCHHFKTPLLQYYNKHLLSAKEAVSTHSLVRILVRSRLKCAEVWFRLP